MRIDEFPKPKGNNGRGIHWSASVYHPTGSILDFWLDELRALNIKWVKLMDDCGGSSVELCTRLLAADIMPVVRLYRPRPNPGYLGGRAEETVRRLVGLGVRYFETNNEPELALEWENDSRPDNWLDIVVDNFIVDADKILGMGGLPAFPAIGLSKGINPARLLIDKGRADLFEKGCWIAIHTYTLNHPLDYPYDAVNQLGAPVSEEDYRRLGPWAWEGQSRELINKWRETDKNPGATVADDASCFLGFQLMNQMVTESLGYAVPIIATEGGPVVGWREDRRYPRLDATAHAEMVVGINDYLQGAIRLNGTACPPNYFSLCHWLIANYRLGYVAPGWETQAWYSDWWNDEFKLQGALPVVARVKAMGSYPIDALKSATIKGSVRRKANLLPLAELEVELLRDGNVVSKAFTSPDGAFSFVGITAGTYALRIGSWGVVQSDLVVKAGVETAVSIELTAGSNSQVGGQLLDVQTSPQAGMPIRLTGNQGALAEALTSADGAFQFAGLPAGVYELGAPGLVVAGITLDGWCSRQVRLTARQAPEKWFALRDKRRVQGDQALLQHSIYGTVTDEEGKPLSGQMMEMSWEGAGSNVQFPTTLTGSDPGRGAGGYSFVITDGRFAVRVAQEPGDVADGLDTARASEADGSVSFEVNFRRAAAASGQIEGQIVGGLPGGEVVLTGQGNTVTQQLNPLGQFLFGGLTAGTYRLELTGLGVIASAAKVPAGGLYRLSFSMRSTITGLVKGAPTGAVAVLQAPPEWGWAHQSEVDSQGRYKFEQLPAGIFRLTVAGQTVSDLVLTGENDVEVPVLTAAASPTGVEPQPVVRQPEELSAAATPKLNEDQPPVAPSSKGHLGGRVLAIGGEAQAGLPVHLIHGDQVLASTTSGLAGEYAFGNLPSGTYAISIGQSDPLVTQLMMPEEGAITQDVLLLPRNGKKITHFLLLPPPAEAGQTRAVFALAVAYLSRVGATAGFSLAEAAQSAQVTLIGDTISPEAEAQLRLAGCQVTRLPGDAYALAEAFERLLAGAGEG
jgi:hypothetical protein